MIQRMTSHYMEIVVRWEDDALIEPFLTRSLEFDDRWDSFLLRIREYVHQILLERWDLKIVLNITMAPTHKLHTHR